MKANEPLTVLGLNGGESWAQVQAAFRRLVLACHPDVNPSPAAASRFRFITAAYETLAARQREAEARSEASLAVLQEDPLIGGLEVRELGERLLYSGSGRLRAAAAYLLGGKPDPHGTVRSLLLRASRDPDGEVRQAVVGALGRVGQPGDLLGFLVAGEVRLGAIARAGFLIWRRQADRLLAKMRRS